MMQNGDVWTQMTLADLSNGRIEIIMVNRSNRPEDVDYDPIADLCADEVSIEVCRPTIAVQATLGDVTMLLYCDEVRDCRGLKDDELQDAPWIYSERWSELLRNEIGEKEEEE